MTDYHSMVAPFIATLRHGKLTPDTITAYTHSLNDSIDFLVAGGYEPNDYYYSALDAHLAMRLAKSTTEKRVTLARRFFSWAQKGELQLITQDKITSKEDTPPILTHSAQEQSFLTGQEVENTSQEEHTNLTLTHPHEEEETEAHEHNTGRPRKSPEGRSRKLTIYLTPALEADVKDLARIARLSTPDYIFRLIEREKDRRADALNTFRSLEED